jgi:hypothetical protein
MLLSSDDLDKLPPERGEFLSMLFPPLPVAARPLDLMERDMPERFEAIVERAGDPMHLVALFNFDDDAKDLSHARSSCGRSAIWASAKTASSLRWLSRTAAGLWRCGR